MTKWEKKRLKELYPWYKRILYYLNPIKKIKVKVW